ncbi:TIGR01777 family oxidoreductase [Legionella waltersii]|uniref:Nucleoside-diphosphate sugar epimerase n=1 Tax=Legionella waltersii TaxID=66969 RepID=A0A0W1ALP0_9GAMM|nr:TIGR01777 family oxidoreductase [Legionella waltersii]KTD82194.1 nucleoside-diphosphate sugar epimerase [Legionella waltersii]SNV10642.1 nucleoside-diphosphate sugar epimerase [Legionella waltersii]
MNILIAGASGFIGTVLVNHLSQSHKITVLGRQLEKLESIFSTDIRLLTWDSLKLDDVKQYELIINLSGSSIGAKRWSPKVKNELIESRTRTNQQLIQWCINHDAKPRFFCANAIGIYGAQEMSTGIFDEKSPLPQSSDDFLQHVGLVWEQSLKNAIDAGIPVTTLRFGVVFKQGEGMLKQLELPFRLGMGSILGGGNQTLSWIYYKDLINAIDFLIEHQEVTGPVNITSPYPVTQKEFAQQFAKALKRPLFLKTPGLVIKILFGEMGDYLLLKGQKVLPGRLNELGFKFTYPKIESVFAEEFKKTN